MHAYGGKAKKAAFYAKKGCFFSVPNTAAKPDSQMVKVKIRKIFFLSKIFREIWSNWCQLKIWY